MKPYPLLLALALSIACTARLHLPSYPLAGYWSLSEKEEGLWAGLVFNDSVLTCVSRADTVAHLRYRVSAQTARLTMTNELGQKRVSTIVKLSPDSLVLDRLWDVGHVQRFHRVEWRR
jgi:hypothetical protein